MLTSTSTPFPGGFEGGKAEESSAAVERRRFYSPKRLNLRRQSPLNFLGDAVTRRLAVTQLSPPHRDVLLLRTTR